MMAKQDKKFMIIKIHGSQEEIEHVAKMYEGEIRNYSNTTMILDDAFLVEVKRVRSAYDEKVYWVWEIVEKFSFLADEDDFQVVVSKVDPLGAGEIAVLNKKLVQAIGEKIIRLPKDGE